QELPKLKLAEKGIDADGAYQIIHDILDADAKDNASLASTAFGGNWAPATTKLCIENIGKNLVDQVLHGRCLNIVADLWHAPQSVNAIGTATAGSSEGVLLGGLCMKKKWQERRRAAGKSLHEPGPNIVMGANAHISLKKFATYFDVEMRLVPVSDETNYCLDPRRAMKYIDENTIGIFMVLGSTYTGHYEPIKEMSDLLDTYESQTGISIPIHVDAAAGGFVSPFAHPELCWDFRIARVVSINASGHKFGLTYVGCGWVIWRDSAQFPKDMAFEIRYFGSLQHTLSLNFSRPAHPIINQYYNFLQMGFEGYKSMALADLSNARLLSRALEKSGYFKVVSDVHRKKTDVGKPRGQTFGCTDANFEEYVEALPLVAFAWSDEFKAKYPHLKQKWIQTLLRAKGWHSPNYALPPDSENEEILRMVIRESIPEEIIGK
ncbi:uncharacterized protein MELLADRAFT_36903, partial [Melampsora larici-populina 98AG31]